MASSSSPTTWCPQCAQDNLKLPFTLRKTRYPKALATNMLSTLGIDEPLEANVTLLSGGEQQRVALAPTLLSDPDVIFVDEPTAALDQDTGRHVVNELAAFATHPGHAGVMVSHRPEAVSQCDSIVRLNDGHIAIADRDSILAAGV
ncbi:ATP-binding cassette domain-containing protein [Bifidobacterium aemilianum]|uniref:ATP-binding cassette domain-containing protein n=1 Tax=Bifidobacterium aemilianum TaxID=2493120 RepID=UPI001EEE1F32|nr:ATP-binding cassette domain-containing protein [Bifidobacterium aemilianum]